MQCSGLYNRTTPQNFRVRPLLRPLPSPVPLTTQEGLCTSLRGGGHTLSPQVSVRARAQRVSTHTVWDRPGAPTPTTQSVRTANGRRARPAGPVQLEGTLRGTRFIPTPQREEKNKSYVLLENITFGLQLRFLFLCPYIVVVFSHHFCHGLKRTDYLAIKLHFSKSEGSFVSQHIV